MSSVDYSRYAALLADYCFDLQPGEKFLVQSTYLAEPLIRELYIAASKRGAYMEVLADFRAKSKLFYDHATEDLLQMSSPFRDLAMKEFDAYLYIRAPYNLREDAAIDPVKKSIHNKANALANTNYAMRTANGTLRRSLCQFPTDAAAQQAGMSLDDYEQFVFTACKLDAPDPKGAWLQVREQQQRIVDHLNLVDHVRYRNEHFDISFRVKSRIWMNSDGRTNMPSGEVYTGPIEDSVNGEVYFDYPTIFMGEEVCGVRLTVENGQVVKGTAERGQDVVNKVLEIPGARYFGEVAIGTNYNIQRPTGNILFDEKIGGTIHMALGQSYKQTGGKNNSDVHWDLIAGMQQDGEIYADGTLIYQKGQFII